MSASTPAVDVGTLLARLDELTVVDVRTPSEYETAHIAGAVNVPLDVLSAHSDEVAQHLAGHPDGSVVLVCQSGARAEQARQRLAATGLTGLVAASVTASLRWPGARFVAGTVGTGLTVAALTDTCLMARALAALPYNRGSQPLPSGETVDQPAPRRSPR